MTLSQSQRIAVIDLGSNTARLVVMKTVPGYAYRLEDEIREVVRLREGMTRQGLSREATERAFFTLRLFKRFCDSNGVNQIIATATSAVREAANGPEFVEKVQQEIGLSLQILDGDREAYYGVLGVLNEIDIKDGVVVDIGGGSAQVSRVKDRRFQQGTALTLGALALTERFIRRDPPRENDVEAAQAEIDRQLDTLPWLKKQKGRRLVGLGGTIRNLAKIEAVRQNYPLKTLHGFRLSQESVAESIAQFKKLPLPERKKIYGIKADRADIILPGAMVIATIMKRLQVDGLTVSINGLREGIFLEQFWNHLTYPVISDARRFGVLNMARVYQYQKAHANHVRYLAGRLFEQLNPLHHYGRAEREMLDAAALLHDLGSIISYRNHHKHSQTLIINSGLAGFTPREVALISLLARFHRKGKPTPLEFQSLLKEDDALRLIRLTAILRLAEFLERGRNAAIDDVAVTWNNTQLFITLIADEYPAVELWQARRNAVSLVETAFERDVILDSSAVT
ncbi:MAG TPA: Ppx/GppA family phosphatase [Anaerolineae bacterium]|nr:Ppx/GppA family phosphatase [Anaerolineae bacterium]